MVFAYDEVSIAVDAGLKYQKQSGDAVFVWWTGGGTASEGACSLVLHQ